MIPHRWSTLNISSWNHIFTPSFCFNDIHRASPWASIFILRDAGCNISQNHILTFRKLLSALHFPNCWIVLAELTSAIWSLHIVGCRMLTVHFLSANFFMQSPFHNIPSAPSIFCGVIPNRWCCRLQDVGCRIVFSDVLTSAIFFSATVFLHH